MIGHLVGNYKITDKIGEGGMGSVFRGIDIMLEREVAIKMLRPELARQPHIVERFRSEAVTLAKLNHPNIATLYSFLRQGEDFFMVMEFVRGETLESLIAKAGAMPCYRAVALFCQALEGIDHAHKMGIVHRDIKPANMMLTEAGSIKVMDFGIARVLGTNRLTKTGHLIGTVEYMSPEQVRGEETDARSDIYSLGILLYEMLTGRVPFNSKSEYELMRSHIEEAPTPPGNFAPLPVVVEQAIMRSLAKKPQARQQSANEFRMMLPRMNRDEDETTSLDVPTTSPASYVTRPGETQIDGSPGGQVMKETKLADSGIPPTAYDEIKETRLAPGPLALASYQQMPRQFVEEHKPPRAGSLASLMSKLNWKHYAGAGAIFLALISLPFVLSAGGDKPSITQPAAVAQPSRNPSSAQDGASGATQPPAAAPSSSAPLDTPDAQADSGSSSRSAKPTQSLGSGGDTTARSSDSTASQGGSRSNTQKRSSSQARDNASGQRSESNKKDAARKTKTEKVVEAAGAVGGVIKGVGGLFGKKRKP